MNLKLRLNELKELIDDNILDMNNIVRLLEDPRYNDSKVLDNKFRQLMKETKELTQEYKAIKSLLGEVA